MEHRSNRMLYIVYRVSKWSKFYVRIISGTQYPEKKISHTGFRACSLFLKNVTTRGSCGLSAIAELLVDTATDTTRNLENIEHMPLAHRCHSLFVGSVLMQAVDHSASEKWFSYNHERRPTVRSLQWETNLFIHLL